MSAYLNALAEEGTREDLLAQIARLTEDRAHTAATHSARVAELLEANNREVEKRRIAEHALDASSFQRRVGHWMQACFGPAISADKLERGDRLLEEVLELLQSGGYPPERVAALTGYVWSRPAGEPPQEAGGVKVTLAAYCLAHEIDMHLAGETELARIWTKVAAIRAKQAAKPTGSALPMAWPQTTPAHEPPSHRLASAVLNYYDCDDEATRRACFDEMISLAKAISNSPLPTQACAVAGESMAWLGPYKDATTALNELRKSVAEIIGADPETWPDHGNAPLAIAATLALARRTHSAPAQEPAAVPAGLVLVPAKPTPEMLGAWYRYKSGYHAPSEPEPADTSDYGAYAAMLAAAPASPPAESGETEDEMIRRISDASPEEVIADLREQGIDPEAGVKLVDDMAGQAKALASTPAPPPRARCMHGTILGGEPNDCAAPDCPCAAPQPGGAVKVKALTWKDGPSHSGMQVAECVFGEYWAWDAGSGCWSRGSLPGRLVSGGMKGAQDAAQADYERRILSALSPSPSGRDAGAEAMREDAAKAAERWANRAQESSRDATAQGRKSRALEWEQAYQELSTLADAIRALPLPTPPAGEG